MYQEPIHNHSSQLPPSTSRHPEITIVQHASGLFTLSSLIIHYCNSSVSSVFFSKTRPHIYIYTERVQNYSILYHFSIESHGDLGIPRPSRNLSRILQIQMANHETTKPAPSAAWWTASRSLGSRSIQSILFG